MDIPVRRHENNAYEAARQAEDSAFREENRNILEAIRYIRRAKEQFKTKEY